MGTAARRNALPARAGAGLSLALTALLWPQIGCGGDDKKAEVVNPATAEPGGDGKIEIGDRDPRSRPPIEPEHFDDGDDDDDEDGVQIKGLRGKLDSYEIQRGIEPYTEDLTGCYNARVGRRRYIGGAVQLDYRVARSGEVKIVRLVKSSLGAWPVEKCLLESARTMRFAKPKGGEAEFSLPLEFAPTRAAIWLEAEAARQQVGEQIAQLRECAGESATRNPRKVTVTLYVGSRGKVQSVGFSSPAKRAIADAWADCAEAKILDWAFEDPLGRVAKLEFRYNGR